MKECRTGVYGRLNKTFLEPQGASREQEHVYELSGLGLVLGLGEGIVSL